MKKIKSIPFSKIDAKEDYYLFNEETSELKVGTGQEIIMLITEKFNFKGWQQDQMMWGDADLSVRTFLKDAEAGNEDTAEYPIWVFERKSE